MAAITRYLRGDVYLADSGARNYLRADDFRDIVVHWQDWREPLEEWPGVTQWRNISCLNYLCRFGPERFQAHVAGGEFSPLPSWDGGPVAALSRLETGA